MDREGIARYVALFVLVVVWVLSFSYLIYLPIFRPGSMNPYLLLVLFVIIGVPVVGYFGQEWVHVFLRAFADRVAQGGLEGSGTEGENRLGNSESGFDDAYAKLIQIAEREFPELALQLRKIRLFGDSDEEMAALVEVLQTGIESRSSVDLYQILDIMEEELAQKSYRESTDQEKMEVVRVDRGKLIVKAPNQVGLPAEGVSFDVYADFTGRDGRGEEHNGVVAQGECVGHRGEEEYVVEIDEWVEELGDGTMGTQAKLADREAEVKVSNPRFDSGDWRRSDDLEDAFLLLRKIASQQETLT